LEPIAEEELKDESGDADILDFADEEPAADHGSASLRAPQLLDEPQESKQPGTESHEEAAQRIDQWFRSAKTLSDVPPLDEAELTGQSSHEMLEPTTHAASGETIDSSSDDAALADVTSDFELETSSASPNDAAPWDDSQHMDRLLADLEGQPIDTYEPESVGHEVAAEVHEEHEHFQPAGDWTPDESLAIPTASGQPERKRSIVRTLVVSAFGGIIGLGLGYYALLWMGPVLHRGKDIDFLQVAQYLPKAILPSVFRDEVKKQPASAPPKMVADLAASEKTAQPEQTKPAEPATTPAPADSTAKAPVAPAEKQATFTAPPEPAKKAADTDDRYAIPAAKSEPAMREPAPLECRPPRRSPKPFRKLNQFASQMRRRSLLPTYQHRSQPQTPPSPGLKLAACRMAKKSPTRRASATWRSPILPKRQRSPTRPMPRNLSSNPTSFSASYCRMFIPAMKSRKSHRGG